MDDQLFNLLSGLGGGGTVAAVFFYLWNETRKELRDVRAGADAKLDAALKRNDDLQEKRLAEALSLRVLVEASNAKDDALLAAFKRDAQ